jgi:hypothetical protein
MIHKKDPAAAQRIKQKVFYYWWRFHRFISMHWHPNFLIYLRSYCYCFFLQYFFLALSLSNYCIKLSLFSILSAPRVGFPPICHNVC